jgi:hypothetical protein
MQVVQLHLVKVLMAAAELQLKQVPAVALVQ